jgi:hypothetical protein
MRGLRRIDAAECARQDGFGAPRVQSALPVGECAARGTRSIGQRSSQTRLLVYGHVVGNPEPGARRFSEAIKACGGSTHCDTRAHLPLPRYLKK